MGVGVMLILASAAVMWHLGGRAEAIAMGLSSVPFGIAGYLSSSRSCTTGSERLDCRVSDGGASERDTTRRRRRLAQGAVRTAGGELVCAGERASVFYGVLWRILDNAALGNQYPSSTS